MNMKHQLCQTKTLQGNDIQRLNGKHHIMGKSPKSLFRRHVCSKNKLHRETVYFCKTCSNKPYLYPDAF